MRRFACLYEAIIEQYLEHIWKYGSWIRIWKLKTNSQSDQNIAKNKLLFSKIFRTVAGNFRESVHRAKHFSPKENRASAGLSVDAVSSVGLNLLLFIGIHSSIILKGE